MQLFKRKSRAERINIILSKDPHIYDEHTLKGQKKWAKDFDWAFKDMAKNGTPDDLKDYLAFRFPFHCWQYNLKDMESTILDVKEIDVEMLSDKNIPPKIGQLVNLEHLHIYDYALSIPNEFEKLKNLKTLGLSFRGNFPEVICKLVRLEALQMRSNDFTNQPLNIDKLIQLKSLQLNNIGFNNFPASVTSLDNLNDLGLGRNNIKEIPADIGKLINLKKLRIDNNPLRKIPKEIQLLKKLEYLDVKQTKLTNEARVQLEKWLPNTEISYDDK